MTLIVIKVNVNTKKRSYIFSTNQKNKRSLIKRNNRVIKSFES